MTRQFKDSEQFKVVSNFDDLINTHFKNNLNAICWQRDLIGNFKEIVDKLELDENITEITADELLSLDLSKSADLARKIILNDMQLLADFGAMPSLNLIKYYERDNEFDFISTDVYSFHVDRSPIETDTFLCTYYGAASDILPNHQATQKILIPEVRQKLQDLYDGPDNQFEEFLRENFFDLHYEAHATAQPINLGLGHLWRLAVDHPTQRSLPCVHRAPCENKDEYRLLLIC